MSKKPKYTDLDPTIVSEVFTRRIAVLAMAGASKKAIAKELGQTEHTIKQIQESPAYKQFVTLAGEQEFNYATRTGRLELARQVQLATKVTEKAMKDYLDGTGGGREGLEAAKTVFRANAIDQTENQQQQAKLTVVLPTGAEAVTFETEKVDSDDPV